MNGNEIIFEYGTTKESQTKQEIKQKQTRKPKSQFRVFRMSLIQNRSCNSKLINLLREFFQRSSAFMVNFCIRKQSGFKAIFPQSHTQIWIFANSQIPKPTRFFKSFFGNSHIETSRLEFPNMLFSTTNSARCQKRSHRKTNRFLQSRKAFVRRIGSAKSINIIRIQFFTNRFDVILDRKSTR